MSISDTKQASHHFCCFLAEGFRPRSSEVKAGSANLSLAVGVERLIDAISVIFAWATVGSFALFSVVEVADRKLQDRRPLFIRTNTKPRNGVIACLLLGIGMICLILPYEVRAEDRSECDYPHFAILHDTPAELDTACRAVADIIIFFEVLGFTLTPMGTLSFAERPTDEEFITAPTHGHFDARRSQIVAFRTSDARPWGQQWSTSLAGSFLRHELVHMAVWQIGAREGTFFRPERHEFIAYAIQLDLMDPDLREVILATHPRLKPFDDLLQINEFTSRMDPELFALAAYSTYRDRGGERFVRELLRAEIVPPEFIYPFPTLPGQTPPEP